MISIKHIFDMLHYLFRFIFSSMMALIIIFYIVLHTFFHNSPNESIISSMRTILLNDTDHFPAHRMFNDTLSSDLLGDNECNNALSLRNLTNRLRIYYDLKLKYLFNKDSPRLLINEFEKNVFPWIRTIDSSLNGYKKETTGIVMCVNDKYFQIGLSAIMGLNAIGNKLPIEIVFNENNELSIKNRNFLQNLPFVTNIFDLSQIFNNLRKYLPIGEKIASTFVKPFAILASSFQHVLLMDADVYFLQKPSNLFNYKEYLNTNFLLFGDRTVWVSKGRIQYLKSIIPQPYSIKFNQSRVIQGISGFEIESGVVLVNKASEKSYLALLITCLLNTRCYRREMLENEQFNGEKETYWLGLEITQAPYHKIDTVGMIGDHKTVKDMVCGRIVHGDESQNPLWWNGGFRLSKKDKKSPWIDFTSYIWEVQHNKYLNKGPCLKKTSQQIHKLTNQQVELIQIYKKYNCSSYHC